MLYRNAGQNITEEDLRAAISIVQTSHCYRDRTRVHRNRVCSPACGAERNRDHAHIGAYRPARQILVRLPNLPIFENNLDFLDSYFHFQKNNKNK
jgi:hypothetical protein